eukprot:scaffold32891_cov29-Attheya_sp.AAC.1
MMKAAEVTIPGEGRISKDWFRTSKDELLKAIGQRKHWFEVWMQRGARTKFKEARRELKNQIKRASKKQQQQQCRYYEQTLRKGFNNHGPINLTILNKIDQRETIETLGDPPTTTEIEAALRRKIPNGKAPGESRITPEALKAFDDEHVYMLKTFLTKYWASNDID